MELMTETEARTYREAHNGFVKRLSRMTRAQLAQLDREEMAEHGLQRISGGPGSKDEFIRSLVELRYPAFKLNVAIHVLYHEPGQVWSACEWCSGPQACGNCGATETEVCKPWCGCKESRRQPETAATS